MASPPDLSPCAPHDDLSFSELAARYNFHEISDAKRVFTRLVVKECAERGASVRALDIGCGRGIGRVVEFTEAIRGAVADFWGVEPDEGVTPREGLFDHFEHALVEDAALPENAFDVAYAYMVMEHVQNPRSFMAAVHGCLKPGGTFLFMTPNGRSYFTRIARLLHWARSDEAVLSMLKSEKQEYHYPVAYRFNDPPDIRAQCAALGFDDPEFVYLEAHGVRGYFPRPLLPLYAALTLKRRVLRNPTALVTLAGRIRKRG